MWLLLLTAATADVLAEFHDAGQIRTARRSLTARRSFNPPGETPSVATKVFSEMYPEAPPLDDAVENVQVIEGFKTELAVDLSFDVKLSDPSDSSAVPISIDNSTAMFGHQPCFESPADGFKFTVHARPKPYEYVVIWDDTAVCEDSELGNRFIVYSDMVPMLEDSLTYRGTTYKQTDYPYKHVFKAGRYSHTHTIPQLKTTGGSCEIFDPTDSNGPLLEWRISRAGFPCTDEDDTNATALSVNFTAAPR